MADTFRNPYNYTSPIGAALADLTRAVISGPSRAEKIAAAEEMLKIKRYNENLLKAQTIIGTPGYDNNAFASAALGAGISGGDLGDYGLFTQDPNAAWDDPTLNNAFIRAGGAPSSTAGAFLTGESNENTRAANALAETARNNDATLTERARQFDQTPFEAIGPDGPQVFTNLTAIGQPAVTSETDMKGYLLGENFGNLGALPPAEQRVLGADASMSDFANIVAPGGGVSIGDPAAVQGLVGQPGYAVVGKEGAAGDQGLTTSVRGGLQNQQIAIDRAGKMLDYVEQLAMKDPTNFGATAWVKGLGQDVGQLAQNVATGLGFTGIQEAIAGVQQDALQNGVNPTVIQRIFNFDPTLGELQGAYGMLVYALASGIAGQEGRELSDADVQRATAAFGNPSAFFSSQQSVLSRLQAARQMLGINEGVVDNALGGAPPAAPAAMPQITDDAQYEALPPGTKFIAPDGTTRVKP